MRGVPGDAAFGDLLQRRVLIPGFVVANDRGLPKEMLDRHLSFGLLV
jgi:hypothetical protein